MTTICKNCNEHLEWHFCGHCGQSAETHKMNFHFLWHDIQHGLLHFDKGILYTSKQLFIRPGYAIREFIEGKRINHFKPISLIIVLATVYGLLYHYFHINIFKVNYLGDIQSGWNSVKPAPGKSPFTFDINGLNEWIGTHYAWAALLQLPLYALGSFYAFRKSGYNYVEHLVLNAFLTGQRLVVHIVSFPLLYLYNETPTLSLISGIIEFAGIALMVWAYFQFFDQYSEVKAFFLTLLSYFYYFIAIIVVSGIIGLVMGIHYGITHHH